MWLRWPRTATLCTGRCIFIALPLGPQLGGEAKVTAYSPNSGDFDTLRKPNYHNYSFISHSLTRNKLTHLFCFDPKRFRKISKLMLKTFSLNLTLMIIFLSHFTVFVQERKLRVFGAFQNHFVENLKGVKWQKQSKNIQVIFAKKKSRLLSLFYIVFSLFYILYNFLRDS